MGLTEVGGITTVETKEQNKLNKSEEIKMKIGINIKIDVTKIDKSRLFKGKKGTYMDLTTFIDTGSPGQYDDHGFISQSTSKDEREDNIRTPILGNCTVFFSDTDDTATEKSPAPQDDNYDDDIPF